MVELSLEDVTPPTVEIQTCEGAGVVTLRGDWNLRGFSADKGALRTRLRNYARDERVRWDLSGIESLDSVGAFVLWQAWGGRRPKQLALKPEHEPLFARWQARSLPQAGRLKLRSTGLITRLRRALSAFLDHHYGGVALLGQIILDLGYFVRHPRDIPWREISATIHDAGGRAMAITGLVGGLIGVVLSYLSSVQLKTFGGDNFIVLLLGISITRELGPMLAAILVAGRSGSAMTARLGVMRVTQELDALSALGISHTRRLVVPKVIALVVVLPLLVVWTDFMGLFGGMTAAKVSLGISYHQFIQNFPSQVPVANFWIGVCKGAVFGFFIAGVACHFGLLSKPNTESLGKQTTSSVVVAITVVILADAVAGILLQNVGL